MMIEVIGFDADDTLWQNEILYSQAKRQFAELLSADQDPQRIEHRLDEIESENIRYYGYGIKSFALSMLETAAEIIQGRVVGKEFHQTIDIIKRMLTAEVQQFEHAEETLAALSAKYPLMLITKGDYVEQTRKIERSGLGQYFRYIEIVVDKTAEYYRQVLQKYNLDPQRFIMVGNSLRSDILPVLELGGQAVYIPFAQTWAHEVVEKPPAEMPGYFEIEHLGQLPALLDSLH
jgi:putative hydrolase of the HAD superfamily